jgi:hypothetical protein
VDQSDRSDEESPNFHFISADFVVINKNNKNNAWQDN